MVSLLSPLRYLDEFENFSLCCVVLESIFMGPNTFLNRQTDLLFVYTGPADPCKFLNGNSTAICNTICMVPCKWVAQVKNLFDLCKLGLNMVLMRFLII